jgi:hypothetical protein
MVPGAEGGTGDEAGHEHTQECAELFGVWRRYHGVAADASGVFTSDDRAAAAHERDMLGRQLTAAGCDPFTLLALEDIEEAEDDAEGTGDDATDAR